MVVKANPMAVILKGAESVRLLPLFPISVTSQFAAEDLILLVVALFLKVAMVTVLDRFTDIFSPKGVDFMTPFGRMVYWV